MFNQYKKLLRKDIEDFDLNMFFPIIRWASHHQENLYFCRDTLRDFMHIKQKGVLLKHFNNNLPKRQMSPYPKAKKEDDKRIPILKQYLCKFYKWSDEEFDKNINVILNILDDDFIQWLDSKVGMEKKELKIFGKKLDKVDIEKKDAQVSLF